MWTAMSNGRRSVWRAGGITASSRKRSGFKWSSWSLPLAHFKSRLSALGCFWHSGNDCPMQKEPACLTEHGNLTSSISRPFPSWRFMSSGSWSKGGKLRKATIKSSTQVLAMLLYCAPLLCLMERGAELATAAKSGTASQVLEGI